MRRRKTGRGCLGVRSSGNGSSGSGGYSDDSSDGSGSSSGDSGGDSSGVASGGVTAILVSAPLTASVVGLGGGDEGSVVAMQRQTLDSNRRARGMSARPTTRAELLAELLIIIDRRTKRKPGGVLPASLFLESYIYFCTQIS